MVERRRDQAVQFVAGAEHAYHMMKGAAPARWPHHQQRFGLGACAAAPLGALRVDQARADRAHPLAFARRTRLRYRLGQIDIGDAPTSRDEDTARGRLQATGRVEAEPRMDVEHVARAVVYMATLPLDTNVQFMTVMATKMPYIGRG
jgi:hypothetical protein